MRVLIFHGYLLGGTGSNVYNARLAEALVGLGHEVHLFTQDRHPERQPFLDAVGTWEGGQLRVEELQSSNPSSGGRCTVYRPDIGRLLPVYVADRYEGIQARPFLECSDAEVRAYVEANVEAVREVAAAVDAEVALANHLVMGPAILARALGRGVPYAVKVHGSALEYTVKRDPARFLPYAREGLADARAVLVGSRHTAMSLWEAMEDPDLRGRTRLGPPGVDVRRFVPRDSEEAVRGLEQLAQRLRARPPTVETQPLSAQAQTPSVEAQSLSADAQPPSTFARDEVAAGRAVERLAHGEGAPDAPLVAFVGKLIVSKGIDLLAAAWPLVLERQPWARLAVVGFGEYRAALERLIGALADQDLEAARAIALAGRALEADPDATMPEGHEKPLRHLLAFLDSLHGSERTSYLECARHLRKHIVLTGRLDHDELADVLPACDAMVVPSTFPEAFGMVAAEAAACGVLPVSAGHSGLAEVSNVLARQLPEQAIPCLSFPIDDGAVRAIAGRVVRWLELDPDVREQTRERLVDVARERWSWEGVAQGVIAAAQGRLEDLEVPL